MATSPVRTRSACSLLPKIPTTMSMPWVTNVNVTASAASKPSITPRSRNTARSTYARMNPKTVLVTTPANAAPRYVDMRRAVARLTSTYNRMRPLGSGKHAA
jgi:hypothetical protein